MFHVGQKVVCVPLYGNWEKFERENPGWEHPIKGHIYTIKEVYKDPGGDNRLGVRLYEILGMWHPIYRVECGWRMEEFKPLDEDERKTDISIFEKILRGETVVPLEEEVH